MWYVVVRRGLVLLRRTRGSTISSVIPSGGSVVMMTVVALELPTVALLNSLLFAASVTVAVMSLMYSV